jgi:phage terminase Nu1 subunit (DNA packaging protein)
VPVSRYQLAAILGVSADRVSEWRASGMPALVDGGLGGGPEARRSTFDAVACASWVRQNRGRAHAAIDELAKLNAARTAEIGLRLATRSGALVPMAAVRLDWANHVVACKGKLRGLPHALRQECPDATDEILRALDRLIEAALNALADGTADADEDATRAMIRDGLGAPSANGSNGHPASGVHDGKQDDEAEP